MTNPPPRESSPTSRFSSAGFTLVEVVLALGIVGFTFIPIFGLFGIGLGSLRQSMNYSNRAMILQSLQAEVRMIDYSVLVDASSPSYFPQTFPRYYDDEGMATNKEASSYTVDVMKQDALVPGEQTSSFSALQLQFVIQGRDHSTTKHGIWAVNNGR